MGLCRLEIMTLVRFDVHYPIFACKVIQLIVLIKVIEQKIIFEINAVSW